MAQDPAGRVRQKSQGTAKRNFTKPGVHNLVFLCSLYNVSTLPPSVPAFFTYRVSERGHVMYAGSTRGKWVAVRRGAFHRQWEDSLKIPLEELFNVLLLYSAVITLKCFLWEKMRELESGVGSATPAHPARRAGVNVTCYAFLW